MPHTRKRYLEPYLKKALTFSPIVGLFGHRQVGKTTLASRLSEKYITLDLKETLNLAETSPLSFLESNSASPLVIDECQMSPALFPALKESVRRRPAPGQFLLTGSVRFSSRKKIRESLTGRIVNFELLPMNMLEAHDKPADMAWSKFFKSNKAALLTERDPTFKWSQFENYLQTGGLPGLFAIRDRKNRHLKFETQLETLLERDLRLLLETSLDYATLRNLIELLASVQGEPLEATSLARKAQVSLPTFKKLLSAFQSMFLIRMIPTVGGEKRPVLFFEDQGEASYLYSKNNVATDILRGVFANLRPSLESSNLEKLKFFQYRTRGGAFVPLAFSSSVSTVGFIAGSEESPSNKALLSAQSFLKKFPGAHVFLLHPGTRVEALQNNLWIAPAVNFLG